MADRAPIASRIAAAMNMSPARAVPSAAPAAASGTGAAVTSSTPAGANAGDSGAGSTASATSGGDASSSSGDSATGDNSASGSEGESTTETPTETTADSDAGSFGSDKERIDAAALAFEKGDLEAMATALGRQIKITHPTTKAFKALSSQRRKHALQVKRDHETAQKQQGELSRAKNEIHQDSVKLSNQRRDLDNRFGWIGQTERAWEAGDMVGFAKGVERMAKGASLATITQRIASAHMGKSEPASLEQRQLEDGRAQLRKEQDDWQKKQADEKAARDKEQGQRSLSEQRQTALSKFGESHARHPFLSNPDDPKAAEPEALEEAFAVYEKQFEAWKAGKRQFKPTPKQVLDELHQKQVRQLKRLGITPAAAASVATAAKAGTNNRPAPKPRLAEPPRTNGKPPTRDDTRASRVALAKKITEQQTRGMRA